MVGTGQPIDLETGEIGLHSTPTVVKDTVLVGSAMKEGMTVKTSNNTKGLARAFDARTGKLIWSFQTIPKPGEEGGDTWLNNSWAINGNTGVWTQITVDEELGLVYLPVESPSSDYYGGKRPGNNLFGESLVCVDLQTGKRKWYFQFVHHPIWDHDLSSAPLIADVTIAGRPRKGGRRAEQAGLALRLRSRDRRADLADRREARAEGGRAGRVVLADAAASAGVADVRPQLGPFPRRPDRLHAGAARAGEKQMARYRYQNDVVYLPPMVGDVNGLLGAITMGAANGGTNWPGGGYDPETHTVFAMAGDGVDRGGVGRTAAGRVLRSRVPGRRRRTGIPRAAGGRHRHVCGRAARRTRRRAWQARAGPRQPAAAGRSGAGTASAPGGATAGQAPAAAASAPGATAPPAAGRGGGRGGGGGEGGLTVQGLSILKPPYGVLAAIDLEKGAIKWRVPHGETPDAVRNHPLLKGMTIPRTGQSGSVGLVITKTLVILGDSQFTTTDDASARRDAARLRQGDRARKSAPCSSPRRRAARR